MSSHSFIDVLADKADVLCQLGHLKEALIMYSNCSDDISNLSPERLRHFVDALSRDAVSTNSSGVSKGKAKVAAALGTKSASAGSAAVVAAAAAEQAPPLVADPWSCTSCLGVLCEPVTLPCGHSICTSCLGKDKRNHPVCRKCGADYGRYNVKGACTNVLVKNLCQKYWGEELVLIRLRTKGNSLFQEAKVAEAIEVYTKAIELGKNYACAFLVEI